MKDPWTTQDELEAIEFMASAQPRKGFHGHYRVNLEERIDRLEAWLETSEKRRWPSSVDPEQCRERALFLLGGIKSAAA